MVDLTGKTPEEMREMLEKVDLRYERVKFRNRTIFAQTVDGVLHECAGVVQWAQELAAAEAAETEKSRQQSLENWRQGGVIGAILLRGGGIVTVRISSDGEIRVPSRCAGMVIGKKGARIKDIRARVNPKAHVTTYDNSCATPRQGVWKYAE